MTCYVYRAMKFYKKALSITQKIVFFITDLIVSLYKENIIIWKCILRGGYTMDDLSLYF